MAPSRATVENYPPEIASAESEQLLFTIKDWSIAHGLTVRPPPALVASDADPHGILATTAPVTLFPSPFPRVCFEQAKSIQKAYNQLYAAISQDEGFLQAIVKEYVWDISIFESFFRRAQFSHIKNGIEAYKITECRIIEVDEFIAELWQVHLKVKQEGYTQVRKSSSSRDLC